MRDCFKCGGDGYIPEYAWNRGGVCFTCGGSGKIEAQKFPVTYHLTDNPNFKFDRNFSNRQQELGKGLYVSEADNVENWHRYLQDQNTGERRKYVVKLDTSKADIIPAKKIPNDPQELAQELIQYYGDGQKALREINKHKPDGETFGVDPMIIAQKVVYAKIKGYDGISSEDETEGSQIILFDDSKISSSEVMTFDEFYEENRAERNPSGSNDSTASIPEPWREDAYYKAGKVAEVPIDWLKKFQGNRLRRNDEQMQELAEDIRENGLREPVMIIIGQEDRRVSLGEGNHRMYAMEMAGMDKVPARVIRQRTNGTGQFYDKMDNVPRFDYFPADSNPEEVFNTFDDGKELTEATDENLANLGYNKAPIDIPSGMEHFGIPVRGVYFTGDSSLVDELRRMEPEIREYILDGEYRGIVEDNLDEVIDRDRGYVTIDLEDFLDISQSRIDEEKAVTGEPIDYSSQLDEDELELIDDIFERERSYSDTEGYQRYGMPVFDTDYVIYVQGGINPVNLHDIEDEYLFLAITSYIEEENNLYERPRKILKELKDEGIIYEEGGNQYLDKEEATFYLDFHLNKI